MKTVSENRHNNLLLLLDDFDTLKKISEKTGVNVAYLSQIKTLSPDTKSGKPRRLGYAAARKIEFGLGLAPGWMDNDHNSNKASSVVGKKSGTIENSSRTPIQELRTHNLRTWFEGKTLPPEEKSYLSQLMSGRAMSFGAKAARRLEKTYSMPPGFLDIPRDDQPLGCNAQTKSVESTCAKPEDWAILNLLEEAYSWINEASHNNQGGGLTLNQPPINIGKWLARVESALSIQQK